MSTFDPRTSLEVSGRSTLQTAVRETVLFALADALGVTALLRGVRGGDQTRPHRPDRRPVIGCARRTGSSGSLRRPVCPWASWSGSKRRSRSVLVVAAGLMIEQLRQNAPAPTSGFARTICLTFFWIRPSEARVPHAATSAVRFGSARRRRACSRRCLCVRRRWNAAERQREQHAHRGRPARSGQPRRRAADRQALCRTRPFPDARCSADPRARVHRC